MTAQVLFFNVFSEKDPHLNAVELMISFQWKHLIYYLIYALHIFMLLILKIKFCMIYFEALARMEAW